MKTEIIRTLTPEQHLDMMNQSIKEISQICTNEDWKLVRQEIRNWNNDKLEVLRVMIIAGFNPYDCTKVIDEIIELSNYTPLTTKEIAIKLSGLINRLK